MKSDFDKIQAVVFDIDGTLAKRGDRGIHDYDLVGEDTVHEDIKELAHIFYDQGFDILIVTGRPEKFKRNGELISCKDRTVAWLIHNKIPFDDIFMRTTGDFRSDAVIKPEIYHAHIKADYDVLYWIDDRDRVVEAMRDEGIRVLQVAPGNF